MAEQPIDLSRLCEFIKKHQKFTAPAQAPDDLEHNLALYRDYMEKHGFTESQIDLYLIKARCAFEVCAHIDVNSPEYRFIRELMFKFEKVSAPRDKRNPNYVIYPVDVVLVVVLLAKLCGCNDCEEYAHFWFTANPYLQCLVPNMPNCSHMISKECVTTCLKLVPDDGYESIFEEMFAEVKIYLKDLLLNQDPNPEGKNYRPTIGGDGQELRASYRKGEVSRRKKGAHAVVVFNCDDRVALGFTTVNRKNHEIDGFTHILQKISVPEDGIFYADALNTRKNFIDFLNERQLDWVFALKGQKATKHLYEGAKERFKADAPKVAFRVQLPPKLESGRIEVKTFEMVPASELGLENDFTAKSVIKVVTDTSFKTNGAEKPKKDTTTTRYYLSSLECTEENFEQIIHSISIRWYYENHHNSIDEVLLQDRQAVCDEDHLAAIIGLNKFAYNVLSFARQKLSQEGFTLRKHKSAKHKPMSYKVTVDTLQNDPSLAFCMLIRYFMAKPDTAD